MIAAALAAPVDGERLHYEASWLGMVAGTAESHLRRVDGGWEASIRSRSAGWVASIYPIDDVVTGTWTDAGSTRYTTRFREGRFQQDQEMEFGESSIRVARRQLIDGVWKEWTDTYAQFAGSLDPVAAVYRLRQAWAGTLTLEAFSGRKAVPVTATHLGADAVDHVLDAGTEKVDVRRSADGTMKPWMSVWFTEDEARVPVQAVVQTRGGPVTVRLVRRELPP